MKQQQTSSFNIFSLFGFACAIILVIGLLKKNGVEISRSKVSYAEVPSHSKVVDKFSVLPVETMKMKEFSDEVKPKPSSSRISTSAPNVNHWIKQFSELAVNQALEKGIPAGISLALGIAKLQSGATIESFNDYINQVIQPLVVAKKNALKEDRSYYFKYSANSDFWAEGLGKTGHYTTSDLKKIIRQYGLETYDQSVRTHITNGTVNPIIERQAIETANQLVTKKSTTLKVDEDAERAAKVEQWRQNYDENVGRDVAKEVARKKLKTGKYLSDEDLQRLVDETTVETEKLLEHKTMMMGRKINPNHPNAAQKSDITNPRNAQARGEIYQQKVATQQKYQN